MSQLIYFDAVGQIKSFYYLLHFKSFSFMNCLHAVKHYNNPLQFLKVLDIHVRFTEQLPLFLFLLSSCRFCYETVIAWKGDVFEADVCAY